MSQELECHTIKKTSKNYKNINVIKAEMMAIEGETKKNKPKQLRTANIKAMKTEVLWQYFIIFYFR